MAYENRKTKETATRGISSQQTGAQSGRQMENRSDLPETSTGPWTGAPPEAVTHQPGQQRSEQAGMDHMSTMIREGRARGGMGTGMGRGQSQYARGLRDREHGMSECERGMSERERAMYDRECAMSDREGFSTRGEREGESSTGGMTSGESRTGGQSGSSQTESKR